MLRSILKGGSGADIANAVAYGKQIKLYPLFQAGNPPVTQFVDAIDVVYDATIPWDMRYFESLNHTVVQIEPWQTRDKAMIDELKTIGIEKGKPFDPDAKTQAALVKMRLVKPMRGWRMLTKTPTSRRPTMNVASGMFQFLPMSSMACRHSSPTLTSIRSMVVALPTRSVSSARNTSGLGSSTL